MEDPTKLYGETAYLLNKIFDKCEEMGGWDDLINHLGAIDDTFETEKDYYYQYFKFIMHVYWRIKSWDKGQPFNQVSHKEVMVKRDGKTVHAEGYSIWNYNYTLYLWVLNRRLTWGMNHSMIDVAKDELTEAEIKRFEKMVEESK